MNGTSIVRLELLEFFESNPHAWETADDLARKIGRDPGSVQEALDGLRELGILSAHGAHPPHRYRYQPPCRPEPGQVDHDHL